MEIIKIYHTDGDTILPISGQQITTNCTVQLNTANRSCLDNLLVVFNVKEWDRSFTVKE